MLKFSFEKKSIAVPVTSIEIRKHRLQLISNVLLISLLAFLSAKYNKRAKLKCGNREKYNIVCVITKNGDFKAGVVQ